MGNIKDIFIEGTAKSPQIDFNHLTGDLILYGKSIPENAAKVYEPLLFWVNEYVKSPRKTTNLRLNLEYFNSATLIWLAKIVKALSKIDLEESVFFIHIYFDLEDFESMESDELKDLIGLLVDNIGDSKVSIGIKSYGTDGNGKIISGSTIVF